MIEGRKKEATIAFTYEVLERVADLRQFITNDVGRKTVAYKDYLNNDSLRQSVREYLNIMERIAVGLNTAVYDLDIFMRICGKSTIIYWEQLSSVVEERRKELQRPTLYIEYEHLVQEIKKSNYQNKRHNGDIDESL